MQITKLYDVTNVIKLCTHTQNGRYVCPKIGTNKPEAENKGTTEFDYQRLLCKYEVSKQAESGKKLGRINVIKL